jgi:hypothetical protein
MAGQGICHYRFSSNARWEPARDEVTQCLLGLRRRSSTRADARDADVSRYPLATPLAILLRLSDEWNSRKFYYWRRECR